MNSVFLLLSSRNLPSVCLSVKRTFPLLYDCRLVVSEQPCPVSSNSGDVSSLFTGPHHHLLPLRRSKISSVFLHLAVDLDAVRSVG